MYVCVCVVMVRIDADGKIPLSTPATSQQKPGRCVSANVLVVGGNALIIEITHHHNSNECFCTHIQLNGLCLRTHIMCDRFVVCVGLDALLIGWVVVAVYLNLMIFFFQPL